MKQPPYPPIVASHPLNLRIDLSASQATPGLATILGQILIDAGATVSYGDPRAVPMHPVTRKSLKGLHVHIDRLTWVRDEEAARWNPTP